MPPAPVAQEESLAARLERRLTIPVLVAALVSVPAVFMTVWGDPVAERVGTVVNWTAAGVLWCEWLLLFALAENRIDWLKRHKWTFTVALATVPAVIFALGPAQMLRIVYLVGSLRILRVRFIVGAGMAVHRRMAPRGWTRALLLGAVTAVSAAFVAVLLLDTVSDTRVAAEYTADHVHPGAGMAIAALMGITALVYWRNSRKDELEDPVTDRPQRDVGNKS